MTTHRIFRPATAAPLLALGLAVAGCGSQAAGSVSRSADTLSLPDAPTVCRGLDRCQVVTTRDVDGDGTADQVGWQQLGKRQVKILVRVGPHRTLTKTVDVRLWWGGGAWAGATRVDGVRGVELLVGSMQGAHTPMYTMLTVRSGRLVVEKSPSPLSPLWQVDAASGDYMGWWRRVLPDGSVTMTQKIAVRIGTGNRFHGTNVTYTWSDGAWSRTANSRHFYATGKQASAISGFHVGSLDRFPGIT